MIDFKFTGDWVGVSLALKKLPQELDSAGVWGQRNAAEKLVKMVKAHINNQDLGWPSRSESTLSGDPRVLVDTEDYLDSIKAWRKNKVYYAGVPSSSYNWRGIRIADYAVVHEYGWGSIPARPLWSYTYKEMGGARGLSQIIKTAIFNKLLKLRSLGFNITSGGEFNP